MRNSASLAQKSLVRMAVAAAASGGLSAEGRREPGAGVLLISEDLEELFELSDRLVVLFGGRIVGAFKPAETDFYRVGHLMTGSKE